jgi:hypothetical protein
MAGTPADAHLSRTPYAKGSKFPLATLWMENSFAIHLNGQILQQ